MLDIIQSFWRFFFAPLLQLDMDSYLYAPIVFSLLILIVFEFIRRLLSWTFSL